MRKVLLVFLLALIALPTSSSAFDGKRKGFVLGGGLGFAPVTRQSLGSSDTNEGGLAVNLVIGYAFDDHNMIVYEGNVSAYWKEFQYYDYRTRRMHSQAFNGISWYHYFGAAGRSLFTVVGLGLYDYDIEDGPSRDEGGGYLLGGGYEFARHFQVGLYLSGGETEYRGEDYGHNHVSVLVNAIAF